MQQHTSCSVPFSEYKIDIVGVALFMEDEQLERERERASTVSIVYRLLILLLVSTCRNFNDFIVLKAMFFKISTFFSYSY